MINSIIDIYHQNTIDLPAAKAGGIVAVIHKATEGTSFRDKKYHSRRAEAKSLGLLWGAYHFSSGAAITDQVENFLKYAQPEDDELIALDWEPSNGPDMSLSQTRHFVQMIKSETGRWPVLYGGHLLRQSVGHTTDEILKNCPLWYARYTEHPIGIPIETWPTFTLWQYTDANSGNPPHDTPGAPSGVDRNIFRGTADELAALWPFTRKEDGSMHGTGFGMILDVATPAKPKKLKLKKKQVA